MLNNHWKRKNLLCRLYKVHMWYCMINTWISFVLCLLVSFTDWWMCAYSLREKYFQNWIGKFYFISFDLLFQADMSLFHICEYGECRKIHESKYIYKFSNFIYSIISQMALKTFFNMETAGDSILWILIWIGNE